MGLPSCEGRWSSSRTAELQTQCTSGRVAAYGGPGHHGLLKGAGSMWIRVKESSSSSSSGSSQEAPGVDPSRHAPDA